MTPGAEPLCPGASVVTGAGVAEGEGDVEGIGVVAATGELPFEESAVSPVDEVGGDSV